MKYFVAGAETRTLDGSSRSQLRGRFIQLSDGMTHYELTGPDAKHVIVLVGSLTVPLFYWDALTHELHAAGLRTLAYSPYGRGYSDRVQRAYDEPLFVRQLAELIERLDVASPLHLVGTSMGALIAMAFANQSGAAIATLTLIGPAGLAQRVLPPNRLLRSDRFAGFVAKRFGRRLLKGHLGHNVRDRARSSELSTMVLDAFRCEGSLHGFFDTLQHFPLFGRADLYRRMARLGVPTMVLWGNDDRVTPINQLPEACALLRPVQHHVIEACGHMAPFELPREVAARVVPFVASHARKMEA